jgi:hypothetical protein
MQEDMGATHSLFPAGILDNCHRPSYPAAMPHLQEHSPQSMRPRCLLSCRLSVADHWAQPRSLMNMLRCRSGQLQHHRRQMRHCWGWLDCQCTLLGNNTTQNTAKHQRESQRGGWCAAGTHTALANIDALLFDSWPLPSFHPAARCCGDTLSCAQVGMAPAYLLGCSHQIGRPRCLLSCRLNVADLQCPLCSQLNKLHCRLGQPQWCCRTQTRHCLGLWDCRCTLQYATRQDDARCRSPAWRHYHVNAYDRVFHVTCMY